MMIIEEAPSADHLQATAYKQRSQLQSLYSQMRKRMRKGLTETRYARIALSLTK